MPNLQVLALARNHLSGAVLALIFYNASANDGSSLRIVQLEQNQFTKLGSPPQGQHLSAALEVLNLKENGLVRSFTAWLTNASGLIVLDISGNALASSLPPEIGWLSSL
ncbi:putative LRR receptor-like serine/threonine-protein kinase [Canna indica]|uniref:LRR receptor-like serine/threonine-protein kinase n=1 Tax=Canna indica TaxID=4628 RepID=A0AAQ3JZK1_9LILI|nr:putative LRR receptor-like serine/threonine-protein kinase [Canna indica]